MAVASMATGRIMSLTGEAFTYGRMEGHILESGKITTCKELGFINGLMEGVTLESMLRIVRKDMEYMNGVMVGSSLGIGTMASSMGLDSIRLRINI